MSRRGRHTEAAAVVESDSSKEVLATEDRRSTVEVLVDARRDANRALAVGEDTSVKLAAQGEQMDRMDRKLDNIEAELSASDKILKTMSGWGGFITGLVTGKKETKKPDVKPNPDAKPAAAARPVRSPGAAAAGTGKAKMEALVEPEKPKYGGYTKDEEDLLDGLCDDVSKLKNIALLHNASLKEQNAKLDGLSDKTTRVAAHTERTNAKVKTLLR